MKTNFPQLQINSKNLFQFFYEIYPNGSSINDVHRKRLIFELVISLFIFGELQKLYSNMFVVFKTQKKEGNEQKTTNIFIILCVCGSPHSSFYPFKHPHPFAILAYFLNHLLVELLNGWLLIREIELKIGLILTTKSIQLWHFDEEHH